MVDQPPKKEHPAKDEKISDQETELELQSLVDEVWTYLIDPNWGNEDIAKLPVEELVALIADFVNAEFPVGKTQDGNHTIGAYIPIERAEFRQRKATQTLLREQLGDVSTFDSQAILKESLIQREIYRMNKDISQMKLDGESETEIQRVEIQRDELKEITILEHVPHELLAVYDAYKNQVITDNFERDCKISSAVLAYLLEKAKQEFGLPIKDIGIAQIAHFPHPFVKVTFSDMTILPQFYDYPARAQHARNNFHEIILQYDRFQLGKSNRYKEFPIGIDALAFMDTTFVNYNG